MGDLFYADVATQKVARLDALDGYVNGKVYLPANDPQLNFAPTVLPEAVGGYFWVVFTTHRSYGNLLARRWTTTTRTASCGWRRSTSPTRRRARIRATRPSSSTGRETVADNLRGFWVLNPCSANGNDCASGDDCCGGFCRQVDGGPLQCVPPPGGCSNEFETCQTAADWLRTPATSASTSRCAQPPTK